MSKTLKVSLIIVSRGRPAELKRLLTSLRFLRYPAFEVVVVADVNPAVEFPDAHHARRIKYVPFDEANISRARNLGISRAAGEIVAFCDDDAVPEPKWLDHLTAPFTDPEVSASGGYVIGRNGISFQWKGRSVDCYGNQVELPLVSDQAEVFAGDAEKGIKTEGTNCAFRRETLVEFGGFDESFHYFLDETDVNFRLGVAGHKTALVPLAQVHHGFAASGTRKGNRAPKSLFEIGASKAYFGRKHGSTDGLAGQLELFRSHQKQRLIRFMLRGEIEPFDVPRLLKTLDDGFADGQKRSPVNRVSGDVAAITTEYVGFAQTDASPATQAVACRPFQWRRIRAKIRAKARAALTIFRLSMTTRFHKMEFSPEGYWIQTGGIFGRSDRASGFFRTETLKSREKTEIARLNKVRPISGLSFASDVLGCPNS